MFVIAGYCSKPGESDQPILARRRVHRLQLGEVIEGVYQPVEVLQPWQWSHLEPIRQSGEGLKGSQPKAARGRENQRDNAGGTLPKQLTFPSARTTRTTLLEGQQTLDGKTPDLKFVPLPLP